jgi:hypothetical protein
LAVVQSSFIEISDFATSIISFASQIERFYFSTALL